MKCEYCDKSVSGIENKDYIKIVKRRPPDFFIIQIAYLCRDCVGELGDDWHKENPKGLYGVG